MAKRLMSSWPIDRVDLVLAVATPHHLRAPDAFVERNIDISSDDGKQRQPTWLSALALSCQIYR
jgi:hypothetical protein